MANSFHVEHFRSPKNLAYIVYALLGLQIIAYVFGIFAALSYLNDPDWTVSYTSSISGRVFLRLVSMSDMLRIASFILSTIFFLIWVYRSYSNLSPLKARNLEFSPGWAVGWWFIPFANLVKAYQVIRELWSASDPDINLDLDFRPRASSGNMVLGFWWGTYLFGNFVLRFSDTTAKDLDSYKGAVFFYLVGNAIEIISAMLLILIVNDITDRQLQRKEKLETIGFGNAEPPPPPIFSSEAA